MSCKTEDPTEAIASHNLLLQDPNSTEFKVDKFLSENKPDIASGVPSMSALLQFESDIR